MTRKLFMAALLASLSLPAAAEGQLGFGLAVGKSVPVGDFGNYAVAGPLFSGLVNVSIPLAPFGFRFEGSLGQYDFKPSVASTGGKVRMLSGTANGMLSIPGPIGPYVIGGIGYYHSTNECNTCSAKTNKVGYNGGVGFRVGLLSLSAFVEARIHYIAGENAATIGALKTNTTFMPLTAGVTF